MFVNLIANPDQLEAVYADRSLVTDAFAETLRFAPPVHMIMRQAVVDVELQGVVIPAGSTITCMLGAANRDPRKFADPDRFDIFRSDNDTRRAFTAAADHVGFINGRHFCVGAMLARTEVELPPTCCSITSRICASPRGSSPRRRASSPAHPTTSRSHSSPRSATGSGRTGAGARAQAGVEGLTASRACKTSGAGPSFRGILSARMSATIPALVASAKAAV